MRKLIFAIRESASSSVVILGTTATRQNVGLQSTPTESPRKLFWATFRLESSTIARRSLLKAFGHGGGNEAPPFHRGVLRCVFVFCSPLGSESFAGNRRPPAGLSLGMVALVTHS
mmetsp:Transcript_7447/g.23019  ORF Transcript_7447/g.23019 Transcript_7447/m.23019 type:complete len:115 (-) Transcript_7447:1238-1582(-)